MNPMNLREITQDSDEWQAFWERLITEYETLCRELDNREDDTDE